MEAAAAPPSLRPHRSRSINPAPATRPGPKPRPWGLAASRRASAVRCELPRRPDPRPLRASAIVEDGGDAGGAGRRKRLAVFVSGGGSNFRAIHEAALAGEVHGDVVALVTDKPGEEDRVPPAARVASGWMFLGPRVTLLRCRLRWCGVRQEQRHSGRCVPEVEECAGGSLGP